MPKTLLGKNRASPFFLHVFLALFKEPSYCLLPIFFLFPLCTPSVGIKWGWVFLQDGMDLQVQLKVVESLGC